MAAPNIVNVSSILGKTAVVALSSTSQTTLLSNAASSDDVLKVNMIQVANVDGANACDITIDVHSAASGGGHNRVVPQQEDSSSPSPGKYPPTGWCSGHRGPFVAQASPWQAQPHTPP